MHVIQGMYFFLQVIEEDYQRKYFQLLNTMNDLQEKFLTSQRSFEELVKGTLLPINILYFYVTEIIANKC